MDNNLLVPRDDINDLSKKDALSWIIETPIYLALLEELECRGLEDYFDMVISRVSE